MFAAVRYSSVRSVKADHTAACTPGNQGWKSELSGVALTIGVILIGVAPIVTRGTSAGIDTLDFFYPMFTFLGAQLRSGSIPGWNPHQFTGTPFAADPESGWTYLPAMVLFAALPLTLAAKALVLSHVLLAATSMYALARVIGITIAGAFVAAISFALSYFFFTRSICCPAHIFVLAWLPAILLFIRLAADCRTWPARIWCWAVAGLALSQTLAGWLGQGAYYALLLTAAFVVYQEVLQPPCPGWPIVKRLGRFALSIGAVFAWAAGFAAAGVLPRLEFVAVSNLANGYQGPSATESGPPFALAFGYPLIFVGASVAVVAIAAPFLARRLYLTPFFIIVAAASWILSIDMTSPLHTFAYMLLPRFADLHRHATERVLLVFHPAVALLAGATLASLRVRPRVVTALVSVVIANLFVVNFWFPLANGRHLDLDAYYSPAGAAEFLRVHEDEAPFRYFGYDPRWITQRDGQEVRYIWQMFEPEATSLLVNNQATLMGLEDIQGYNPLQLQRYVEFIDRMNGEEQEYHGRYVLGGGLDSPLLDLLNARFIVIPAEFAPDRADLQGLVETLPVVYRDDLTQIVENRDAFPRAWIVHEARQVEPGAALDLLATGAVDARTTALLEVTPPPVAPAVDLLQDMAIIEAYEPDAIRMRVRNDAPGMLVLSETYFPAWRAYVDGVQTPIFVADHALRAVPLTAGEHVVEMRYESNSLRAGLVISLVTVFAFFVLSIAAVIRIVQSRGAGQNGMQSIAVRVSVSPQIDS